MGARIPVCTCCGYPMMIGRKYHRVKVAKDLCKTCLEELTT